jgi:hypothetical protein
MEMMTLLKMGPPSLISKLRSEMKIKTFSFFQCCKNAKRLTFRHNSKKNLLNNKQQLILAHSVNNSMESFSICVKI